MVGALTKKAPLGAGLSWIWPVRGETRIIRLPGADDTKATADADALTTVVGLLSFYVADFLLDLRFGRSVVQLLPY